MLKAVVVCCGLVCFGGLSHLRGILALASLRRCVWHAMESNGQAMRTSAPAGTQPTALAGHTMQVMDVKIAKSTYINRFFARNGRQLGMKAVMKYWKMVQARHSDARLARLCEEANVLAEARAMAVEDAWAELCGIANRCGGA